MSIGVVIDYVAAERRLIEAVEIARSGCELPQEWLDAAAVIGKSTRKTDSVVLGCALLAKAYSSQIDPYVVRHGVTDRGYNMRNLAEYVLAPCGEEYGFDIGSGSPNPLNGNTWIRIKTLADITPPREPSSLERLIDTVRAADALSEEAALFALAAWIRVRTRIVESRHVVEVVRNGVELGAFIQGCRTFIYERPERGARGQALVAAALSLVWDDLRTGKITDPSRHWPGDVHAFDEGLKVPIMAAEVKQRPARAGEVRQFLNKCIEHGINCIFYAALDRKQDSLDLESAAGIATRNDAVFRWIEGVDELVLTAVAWSGMLLEDALRELATGMVRRLGEVELSDTTQLRWAELVGADVLSGQVIPENRRPVFQERPLTLPGL
ncbi:restriction endonuclease, SacI family [Micromonospora zamorensis]|uniref:restriction endonuclease, SacI family n=1 Tax=Micromonospora zamorensis TaxID=709883 RepID=UPI00081FBE7E|nr:restriction endonuclease, SacI family [Micromonospora zamorensis]SCG69573.1 SacI restriction endonuclease [Micromonospora zamorensis]